MMENGKIHIAMAADDAYRKGLEVARESMISSCSVPERLEFHLFDDDPELMDRIRREFGTYKGSPMAFLRLYLGELLPDVDWVVYSDVDTLWYRDVQELWSLRDETKTIQWVKDILSTREEAAVWQKTVNPDFDKERYGCSGVMLFNLKRFREERGLEKAIEFTKKNGLFKYVDQDILNALYNDRGSGFVPECWDVVIPSPENTSGGCVYHIVGVGRCFNAEYSGKICQYRFWEHVAKGRAFIRPWSLPFYMRDWMIRVCLPFSNVFLRDRIRRNLAWRWFLRKFSKR